MIRSRWLLGTVLHVVGMYFTLAAQWLLLLMKMMMMMAVRMTWSTLMMPPSILPPCKQSSLLPLLPPHSLWTLNPTLTPASPHHQASSLPPHSSEASSPSMTWWMWTQWHLLMHFLALGPNENRPLLPLLPSFYPQISQTVHHFLIEPLTTQPLIQPLITTFIKCLPTTQSNLI